MLKFAKPTLLALLVVEIASIFVMLYIYDKFVSDPQNYTSLATVNRQARKNESFLEDEISDQSSALPKKFLIEGVPFAVQSPDALWDEIAEESCEEAAMLMVHYYWSKEVLNKTIALQELKNLIDFEIRTYGDFRDENAQQIAQRLRDYFGYNEVEIIYDFSLQALKRKIVEGRPIIVPAAGRLLGNPNFKQPGPLYHNLVIVGYDGDEIVTNDPGTKKGEAYRYNENILYNAIHDFPGSKEEIEQGRKAMIIVIE